MPGSPSFIDLNERLRAGDEDAAARVFELYGRRLISLARSRLHERLRGKVGPEDVLQSVLKSFFCRVAGGTFELSDWDGLWTILVVITLRKCGKQIKYYRRACRAVSREAQPALCDASSHLAFEAIAREPMPDEAAQLVETLEQVQRGFDEQDRQVVVLSFQGLKPAGISHELKITERRVYRVMERVRARLQRLREAD